MAALKKLGVLPITLLKTNSSNIHIYRYCSGTKYHKLFEDDLEKSLNPNFKKLYPARRPQTEEEKKTAAKRYGLHPSEYKPYPDDERSLGDYPELPKKGVEAQDPYYPWDFPALRRNYGEAIHYEFDMMGEDRYHYGVRKKGNYHKYAVLFVIYYFAFLYIANLAPLSKPYYSPKQYPYRGEVHYSFPDLD